MTPDREKMRSELTAFECARAVDRERMARIMRSLPKLFDQMEQSARLIQESREFLARIDEKNAAVPQDGRSPSDGAPAP
jgi:hypothetical protein